VNGRTEYNCAQGSYDWHISRLGKVTASHAADVVTPFGKATASKARDKYRNELLAERMTGKITQHFMTDAMKRGTELEPRARAWYELETGHIVRQVGFVVRDDVKDAGCSPDGLIAETHGLEIKCPLTHTLIGQLLCDEPPAEYVMQVQFCAWVCGLPAWDLVLFSDNAGVPSRIYTIAADEKLHASFDLHVPAFLAELAACEARLIALGGIKQAVQGSDAAYDQIADGMSPMPDGKGR
jgi:putative phage-type endonuclease